MIQYSDAKEPLFVAPNAVEPSAVIEIGPGTVNQVINSGMPVPNREIIIWGRSDYEDIYGKLHFVEWCYRARFDRHKGDQLRVNFIQWGKYNRTDQDGKK
jgi:hypothetical protein